MNNYFLLNILSKNTQYFLYFKKNFFFSRLWVARISQIFADEEEGEFPEMSQITRI